MLLLFLNAAVVSHAAAVIVSASVADVVVDSAEAAAPAVVGTAPSEAPAPHCF